MKDLTFNTPLIKINYEYKGKIKYIYTKLEYYNLTGSIKDRVAYYIIKNAKEKGLLKENMPIVEATSGNTGISLAAFGAYFNHPVYIYMPTFVSKERVELIKSYGANIILVSNEEGGFIECIKRAKEKAKEINGFYANQFANLDNYNAHFETTATEIKSKLKKVDAFVSGIGTGGTLMGTGIGLKEKFKDIKIVALEPDKMPLLSKGTKISNHKIEGIGDDFIPELVDKNKIDDIVLINDDDAVNMSRILSQKLGLGVGISSGANFLASILTNEKFGGEVVTVFADDNKKYLSTDLSKELNQNKNFISNNIKLIDFEIIKES